MSAEIYTSSSNAVQSSPRQMAEQATGMFFDDIRKRHDEAAKALEALHAERKIAMTEFEMQESALRTALEAASAALKHDNRPQAVDCDKSYDPGPSEGPAY